jgi:hypothetical protein
MSPWIQGTVQVNLPTTKGTSILLITAPDPAPVED